MFLVKSSVVLLLVKRQLKTDPVNAAEIEVAPSLLDNNRSALAAYLDQEDARAPLIHLGRHPTTPDAGGDAARSG